MSRVAIEECDGYSKVKTAIESSIDKLGGIEKFVGKNQKVLLKPNLCEPLGEESAAVTHPLVIKAIIEMIKPITPHIFVGDLPAMQKKGITNEVLQQSGLMDVLKETKTKFVNLENASFLPRKIEPYNVLEKTDFGIIFFYVDNVINIPKLKTHGITHLTGAVKNLFGLVHPKERQYLHKNFNDEDFSRGLVDIYSFLKSKISLNIMDAITAMEGNEGPSYGNPVQVGYILSSDDAVGMDSIAAKITGHSPLAILTNKFAQERGLGEGKIANIQITGNMEQRNFKKHDNYLNRNKKMRDNKLTPFINNNCIKCGNCYEACPVGAIESSNNGYKINLQKCIKCYCCLENCIYYGITLRNPTPVQTADVLRLGKKCNQGCVFCTAVDDHNTDLSTEKAKQIIDFLMKQGCGRIVFTGGEPTVREDVLELVEFAKNLGFFVELQTNAVKLSEKPFMKKLISSGVDEFTISIHSHKKEVYQKITGTDFLEKALKGLDNITKHQRSVDISHVINKYNYKDLKEFTNYIVQNYSSNIHFYISFIRPNPSLGNSRGIVPSLSEARPYMLETFKFLRDNNINFKTEGIPFCFMQGFEEHNSEAERVKSTPNYHIEDGVFVEDTHKTHMLKNKASSERCRECDYEETCPRVWKEYAQIYGTTELKPIKGK